MALSVKIKEVKNHCFTQTRGFHIRIGKCPHIDCYRITVDELTASVSPNTKIIHDTK